MSDILQLQNSNTSKSTKFVTVGKLLTGITAATAIALSVISIPFISPALRRHCLPYVPATDGQIRNVLIALQKRQGHVVDLGSGDGRIVLEIAQNQFESHGVELNLWLVVYSKIDAFQRGLFSKTKFFRKDLWKFSLLPYNNVVIFGVEEMMSDLEEKILKECRNDSRIIACRFPLPNLQPQRVIGHGLDTVWMYDINKTS